MKLWQGRHRHARYEHMGDQLLIQAVVRQEDGAWEAFVHRTSALVYTLCATVFPAQALEAECLKVFSGLRAQNFAVLRAFDGRATLATYLTLTLSDLLASRIRDLFDEDTNRAWAAFERFFRKDILQIVAKYFPAGRAAQADGSTHEDRYQEICLLLIEQDYHRIRAFNGLGSFPGYLRRIIRNLCVDLLRREEGRWQLPESIKQLPTLEQEVFKCLSWDGYEEEAVVHTLVTRGYTRAHVEQALSRVRETVAWEEGPPRRPVLVRFQASETAVANQPEVPDSRREPEQTMIEGEAQAAQEQLLAALQESIVELPADMQLYIHLRFFTTPQKPPREIARLMQRSEVDIYKMRQQAVAALKNSLMARGIWESVGAIRL